MDGSGITDHRHPTKHGRWHRVGPILRKPDRFSRIFFGATSSEGIGEALREAGERDDIKAVFLNIDSPGGTVAGTPELAAVVKALNERKPVYAFSSGLMASAAYWVASQARAIYATPSAQVGSNRWRTTSRPVPSPIPPPA